MIGDDLDRATRADTADLTDRQNIQLHWIRIEDVPEIWRRLEAVGLLDHRGLRRRAAGDPRRPLAGIAADELIDPTPTIREITRRYIGDPAFSNLPRKFKSAITGHPSLDVVHEINDIAFVGVVHPELGVGLRPLGRRRALDEPAAGRAARRVGRARGRRRRVGRRRPACSATTATGGCGTRRG